MKKIGIFSGSFNPIHIGHLALANWICEYEKMDEIWFLITPLNPLKENQTLIDDQIRLEMAKAAVGDYSKFIVSDYEFHLPKPTYSIDTLDNLTKKFPEYQFHFIIGADNWVRMHLWKDYEKLISTYPVIIYPRKGFQIIIPEEYQHIYAVDAPEIEISSTFIRESYKQGKDVRYFLPESIRSYFINDSHLY
ncbi:nicotinate-nucleotide adenylyltransferase [Parabacteroides sp. OttesenSCG-928-G07]|nr:nicotinate-nucleotide adenylyltransferase [Parabacteroides sp. OttesenSCG-928-G21]MDL2277465.1 nicotinate-nucleotide adenylyltransferase [Parabacteroides sp. OttesenSCG-928-G07]